MESLIGKIHQISTALKNAPDGEYNITIRFSDSDQIKRAAEDLNMFLYHPYESKPQYWFVYEMENSSSKKIIITVKG